MSKPIGPDNLPEPWNIKQYLFALEYIADKDRNATQCAIRAGYSERSAHNQATRLINHDEYKHVQDFIAERIGEKCDKYGITAEKLFEEQAAIAFSNILDVFTVQEDGTLEQDLTKLTRAQAAAIKSIEITDIPNRYKELLNGSEVDIPAQKIKLQFWDKVKSHEMCLKNLELIKDRIDVNIDLSSMDDTELARHLAFYLTKGAMAKED